MVKAVGYWDIWYQHKESEYDISWRFMLKHFGVDEMILIPNLGTVEKLSSDPSEIPLIEMDSIQDALTANKGLTPIMVDERGTTKLKDFKHPENVMYIFGRTGYNPVDGLKWKGESVQIESEHNLGNGNLHPNQACAIVLYDRMRKQWQ